MIEKKVEPEVHYDGLQELFAGLAYGKVSLFQQKVREVRRICRVSSGDRSPNMRGRILGSATNKYLNFVAETGSPIALIPRSVAIRNKLDIYPPDLDEVSYAGASGTKLTVIGQCHMFVNFKEHKKIKELRALVIAEEGDEILVGLDT